ncbi:uncharacterized protein BT62DRAFT_1061244 [Guyanagaster necrorhizus]|uniref:Uncharacterized protein n=1 Tax=Guyanagaster necrorhizus TaxID=856835 RepID=A0A9P8AU71_9AGAR|nr:uncharacterized protein BT62DRAFT_1061244 [Guyanagaster necrorhizus MCA 3950]KAG7447726.1 hypothetical protein BT62DRAFT_1061244 [Guyanagaster necrorhizus MCA 3950]
MQTERHWSSIVAANGDIIKFTFTTGYHRVLASSFISPCTPSGGFDSGGQTVPEGTAVNASGLPTVSLQVNSTGPLWYAQRADGRQCNKGGVLSINPTVSQTTAQFIANAISSAGSGDLSSTTTSHPANCYSTPVSNVTLQTTAGLGLTDVMCRPLRMHKSDVTCFYVDLSLGTSFV